jgi:NAD(P)-dependent dehydrogenase (short-subunit alcohol dehydrogenase family)
MQQLEDYLAETHSGKRVALVTGANQGIGFETARQLGKKGITILMGNRDEQKGQKAVETLRAEGLDARLIVLDVTKQNEIDAAAAQIGHEFGKLDILVNNAGILLETVAPSECELENLRKTFDTNVFGLFAVTKAFLPLLRKSSSARIVNVTSGLGSLNMMSDPQRMDNKYFASKAAVNMMTVALARELRGTRIKINSAAPGYTATALNNYSGHQTVEQGTVASFKLATLPDDGPTGGFLDASGIVAW